MKPTGLSTELEEACLSYCPQLLTHPRLLCLVMQNSANHAGFASCTLWKTAKEGSQRESARLQGEQATLFIPPRAVAMNITSEVFLHHAASLLLPHGSNWNQFIVFITLAESVSLCPPPKNTSKNCLMPRVLRPGSQVHRALSLSSGIPALAEGHCFF